MNKIEGNGTYTWGNGSTYTGNVKSNKRDGFGVFKAPDEKAVYEGNWIEGKRNGKAKLTFKSGACYEG